MAVPAIDLRLMLVPVMSLKTLPVPVPTLVTLVDSLPPSVAQEVTPEPLVVRTWPLVPAEAGRVKFQEPAAAAVCS